MNSQFTIRREKPTALDPLAKCYIREQNGGWSACITGLPTDKDCNVLSNCVGYAAGRFCEIYDEISGQTGCRYKYFNGNPNTVPERVKQFYPELSMTGEPRIGDLVAWEDHVAIVEDVISDDILLISDSAYRGSAFRLYQITNTNGNWDRKTLLGFVHNPLIKDEPLVVEPVERNEEVDQIQIDMDNYSNCRTGPSLKAPVIGSFKQGYYNVLGISEADGYTWYQVGEYQYVAGTIHIKYLEATIPEPVEEGIKVGDTVRINLWRVVSFIFRTFRVKGIDDKTTAIKDEGTGIEILLPLTDVRKEDEDE